MLPVNLITFHNIALTVSANKDYFCIEFSEKFKKEYFLTPLDAISDLEK